jgi:archaemetzincin
MRRCLLPLLLVGVLAALGAAGEKPHDEPILVLVPLGDPSPDLVTFLAESLRARFRLDVRVSEPYALPASAWYAPRKRWRAEKLLDHLDSLPFLYAWRVCGITEAQISTTKGKRHDYGIAGLARMGGKSSVLTAYLFRRIRKKSRKRYRRYMENLVLHEVGHTLGVDHCPLDRCIMADAKGNALRAARRSSNQFCQRCTALLAPHLRDPSVKGRWSKRERAILEKLSAPR